ncbi:MAG: 50S ribosomal protein L17 [Candidatus Roizmanbacteria bacterium GW2011_GWA2_35_19]|uniref:50S ribosomal protein L17 n=2 Tax=Candidatus Roizmaniibacteriota TaxID=1752723 RepID=A0A0G0C7A1_9BACT|nr:MAG: 50S ribosomal protein L17 [Candidatus Roizmanbacteria bacterium GW2011_GWC2_35_12]KKP72041.1 MAG: 50S ribosomal protein L17 [Candidatus Roizmanbacteria bacterium GW2011_GWA2_35_19]
MKHGFKKYKFSHGQDSDQMLIRKLLVNFLTNGKLESTITKLKALKPLVDRIVTKVKRGNTADNNKLLQQFGNLKPLVNKFEAIKESLSKVNSGFVRIVRIGARKTDGALVARLEWAYPVISKDVKKSVAKISEVKKEKKI